MHECNQAISGWKEYHMSENTISLYVYKGGQGEITEKKSRFIATVRPVESEDEAVSFINETKKRLRPISAQPKRNTGMQGKTAVPLL